MEKIKLHNNCKFSEKLNSAGELSYPCSQCLDDSPPYKKWQPMEEPMKTKIDELVARVRKIYPDADLIEIDIQTKSYKQREGLTDGFEFYRGNSGPATIGFPTLEALESHVTELEEKHRRDNMTDLEKVRELIGALYPDFTGRISQRTALDFIDSLKEA